MIDFYANNGKPNNSAKHTLIANWDATGTGNFIFGNLPIVQLKGDMNDAWHSRKLLRKTFRHLRT